MTYSTEVSGGAYYSNVTKSYYKSYDGAVSAESAYNAANTSPYIPVAQPVTTQPVTPSGGNSTPPTYTPLPTTTPSGREIDYGEVITPPPPLPPTTESGREIDYGTTPTYTVTTPSGETTTFDDYMDAQNYAVENSPIVVTTIDSQGAEQLHTFEDPDAAQRYIDRIQEGSLVTSVAGQGIPGPALGPRPGSLGYGFSQYLTGGLQYFEGKFEDVAVAIRYASSDLWTKAAEAKTLNDVVGTIGYAGGATAARIAAGIYEGATFIARPAQWGQLVSTPILIASNPVGYIAAARSDLGGLVLEGIGGFIGGYGISKVLGKAVDVSRSAYNRSEYAQLKKLHPLIEEQTPDFSSNQKFGILKEPDYVSSDPLQRLRGKWGVKPMYSSLVPVFEIEEILMSPRLRLALDPRVLGAITSLGVVNRLVPAPITTVETVDVKVTTPRLSVSPSTASATRLREQREALTPITSLIDEVLNTPTTTVGEDVRTRVNVVDEQIPAVIPATTVDTTPQEDVVSDVESDVESDVAQDVVEEVVPVAVVKVKERLRLRKMAAAKRREEERRAPAADHRFTVQMRYGRRTVTRDVPADTFREALAKTLSGTPSEVTVRRRR